MNKLLGLLRRCIDDYRMIEPGDRICVGVSGGKDSLALLVLMAKLREFYPSPFDLCALTIDLGLGMDFSPVEALCRDLGIEYRCAHTQIGTIIFDYRKEKNPCSMCSKMRRGALNEQLLSMGCTKVALGHHRDDAVETFLMSLFYEGRISCFQPVTYLDRTGVTQIRPMLYLNELQVQHFAESYGLPVIENNCPADKKTKRQEIKELIYSLSAASPDLKDRIFGAMQRLPLDEWQVTPHTRSAAQRIMSNDQSAQPGQPQETADERGENVQFDDHAGEIPQKVQ